MAKNRQNKRDRSEDEQDREGASKVAEKNIDMHPVKFTAGVLFTFCFHHPSKTDRPEEKN
jgi:hypothetical protein